MSGIVRNEHDDVLLVKNRRDEWGWTGGQVEIGENLIEAAAREIREESGIVARIDRLVVISSNTRVNVGHGGVTYLSYVTQPAFELHVERNV